MRKSVISFTLLSTLSLSALSAVHPRPANAIVVGAVLSSGNLLLIGIVGTLGFGSGILPAAGEGSSVHWDEVLACAIPALGAIVLDGETHQPSFAEISEAQAKRIHLSDSSMRLLNDNRDELSSVAQDIQAQLSEMKVPTKDDSIRLWSEALDQNFAPSVRDALREFLFKTLEHNKKGK